MWMNEYEIDEALDRTVEDTNLETAARILYRLKQWTNSHSDGWPYWKKPANAATKLMSLLQDERGRLRDGSEDDITEAELKAALTPIKSFLTRHGVNHSEVMLS